MSEEIIAPPKKKRRQFGCIFWCVVALVLIIGGGVMIGPISGTPPQMEPLLFSLNTKLIARALNEYAQKHQGVYPKGESSTQIFQALLDDGEINDPRLFCESRLRNGMSGMDEQQTANSIKPENVRFDLTVPLGKPTPGLPIVFMTGYRIEYAAGASAVPLSPRVLERNTIMAVVYANGIRAFFRNVWWWFGRGVYLVPRPDPDNKLSSFNVSGVPFDVTISQTTNSHWSPDDENFNMESEGARLQHDGTIVKFIPSTFDASGVKYRQLTPNGPLSP